jgi:hypothetical protein
MGPHGMESITCPLDRSIICLLSSQSQTIPACVKQKQAIWVSGGSFVCIRELSTHPDNNPEVIREETERHGRQGPGRRSHTSSTTSLHICHVPAASRLPLRSCRRQQEPLTPPPGRVWLSVCLSLSFFCLCYIGHRASHPPHWQPPHPPFLDPILCRAGTRVASVLSCPLPLPLLLLLPLRVGQEGIHLFTHPSVRAPVEPIHPASDARPGRAAYMSRPYLL